MLGLAATACFGSSRKYQVTGLLLAADFPKRTITVSCKEIPGYMDAMAMLFAVHDPKTLEGLEPGV